MFAKLIQITKAAVTIHNQQQVAQAPSVRSLQGKFGSLISTNPSTG